MLALTAICPLCQERGHRLWSQEVWRLPFLEVAFRLARCDSCDAIFCTPRPGPAELKIFYEKYFDFNWYRDRLLLKKIQAWHRWQRVRPLLMNRSPGKRLLDVGCGHGAFLFWAKRNGWDAVGIDYPSAATHYAKNELGLKIIESHGGDLLESAEASIGYFDLITMWHVLEHTSDPLSFIAHGSECLAPTGQLLIAVPNAACPGMQRRRERWVWCQAPYIHTVHFSPNALRRMVEKLGLETASIWSRDTWDANRLFDIQVTNLLDTFLSGGNAAARAMIKPGRPVNFYLAEGLRVVCYTIGSFKHWALGVESSPSEGSELLILAQPRSSSGCMP